VIEHQSQSQAPHSSSYIERLTIQPSFFHFIYSASSSTQRWSLFSKCRTHSSSSFLFKQADKISGTFCNLFSRQHHASRTRLRRSSPSPPRISNEHRSCHQQQLSRPCHLPRIRRQLVLHGYQRQWQERPSSPSLVPKWIIESTSQ
jgi:hypothetical protein